MKNQTTQLDAATSNQRSLFDKKKANLTSNNTINFQLGLIAALLFAWAMVELTTEQVHIEPVVTKIPMETFKESNLGNIRIIPNEQPQPVQKEVVQLAKTVTSLAPPKIVKNTTLLSAVEPVSTLPTVNSLNTIAPSNAAAGNPTGKATVNTPASPTLFTVNNASEAPLYPGCSTKLNNADRVSCFNEKIQRFVIKNFDTTIANKLSTSQVRFTVMFTLDSQGEIVNILVKSKEEAIEKEARRVINKLPDMTPGRHNSEAIDIQYVLPIIFNVLN